MRPLLDSWRRRAAAWPWPLPAVFVWLVAGVLDAAARGLGVSAVGAAALATLAGVLLALVSPLSRLRRVLMGLGFPLAWWLMHDGAVAASASGWLLTLLVLLALYPVSAWRDAPLFPTPHDAFVGLPAQLPLGPAPAILDAGSGLGDGLIAWQRAYPAARLSGIERSGLLAALSALRVRPARVRVGDFWRADWSPYTLVYLFQRPETMARAWAKATRELAPGAWLASLEFPVPGRSPDFVWDCPDGRRLWLYQVGAAHPGNSR